MKVILNPAAGRGRGAKIEGELQRYLLENGLEFDLERTSAPGHAAELASRAASEGFETVVAVGGDGTSNEVVNGILSADGAGAAPALGLVPVGSGCDFAYAMGVPSDLGDACNRLANGTLRQVDTGRVSLDGGAPRYFDNTVGVGFDAIVTYEALKVKRLRGMALYLPVVLKTVFLYGKSPMVTLEHDAESVTLPAMMVCTGNGSREGGGFFVTPNAEPDDGMFDVCIVRELGRLSTLSMIPRFMNGSHVDRGPVTMLRTRKLKISSPDNLIAHVDGEMLCTDGHELEIELFPRSLQVRC
jgi:YegS/Rv2252/BmrU family lipid kinase